MSVGRSRTRHELACLLLLVAGACFTPEPQAGSPCADDSRCPKGQRCIAGFCGGTGTIVIDTAEPQDAAVDATPDGPPLACVNDPDCPNTNPCVTVACVDNTCVPATNADGTQCGPTEAERCCTGACVNIAADAKNCGGCGQTCATGRVCESVSVTAQCDTKPATTSGRCTCAGANSECPDNQICRTVNPYQNRCTPDMATDCAAGQMLIDVNLCPNFCRYPE